MVDDTHMRRRRGSDADHHTDCHNVCILPLMFDIVVRNSVTVELTAVLVEIFCCCQQSSGLDVLANLSSVTVLASMLFCEMTNHALSRHNSHIYSSGW